MSVFEPAAMFVKCDPRHGKYMACCMMYRGDVRQPLRKLKKFLSLQDSNAERSFVFGRRFFPREFGTMRGLPCESKNIFLRLDASTSSDGGTPKTCIIQESCSISFSPGNRG